MLLPRYKKVVMKKILNIVKCFSVFFLFFFFLAKFNFKIVFKKGFCFS